MHNVLGLIFADSHYAHVDQLTKVRPLAALPINGRYRSIDFVLSNMVNSNISSIGLITKYNYQSLMDHLGSGLEWDLSRKNANFYILPPFASGVTNVYRGNLEALSNEFPEEINLLYAILEDEALNSGLPPAVLSAYLKKRLGYDKDNGADELGETMTIRFEHNILDDGE